MAGGMIIRILPPLQIQDAVCMVSPANRVQGAHGVFPLNAQLMWMFREAIGVIYKDKPMEEAGKAKRYWTSTEKGTDNAWFFDFTPGKPHCDTQDRRTATGMVRCVSDY